MSETLESRLAKLQEKARQVELEIERRAAAELGVVAKVLGEVIGGSDSLRAHIGNHAAIGRLSARDRSLFAAWFARVPAKNQNESGT